MLSFRKLVDSVALLDMLLSFAEVATMSCASGKVMDIGSCQQIASLQARGLQMLTSGYNSVSLLLVLGTEFIPSVLLFLGMWATGLLQAKDLQHSCSPPSPCRYDCAAEDCTLS